MSEADRFGLSAGRRVMLADYCGMLADAGPNGEPLLCGYSAGHEGVHSWARLPGAVDAAAEQVRKDPRPQSSARNRAKRKNVVAETHREADALAEGLR